VVEVVVVVAHPAADSDIARAKVRKTWKIRS
jgi:hypothetical protein